MTRKNFDAKTKLAAWKRSNGQCEVGRMSEDIKHLFSESCMNVPAECDHIKADILDGEPTLENAAYLCKACHKIKTKSDNGYRAKRNKHSVNRNRPKKEKRAGRKLQGGSLQSCEFSKIWKRTVSGKTVKREK